MSKKKDTLYYVETDRGCGIRAAQNLQQAEAEAKRETGTDGFKSVRKATEQDIKWVRSMGGYIPSV